jgi:tryptophan synthase alpha chain
LADGVTIQKASFSALHNGVTPKICFEVAKQLSHQVDIPLAFMSYFNPVVNYGLEKFCTSCVDCGVSGLIVPDLLPEEGIDLEVNTQNRGLDLIYFLAPTSTGERIKLVVERSRGFIYLVSVTGVTGARGSLPTDLEAFVKRVKQVTDRPLCIGFGISTAKQAKQVTQIADGVIVGSRIVQLMEADESMAGVVAFIKELMHTIDRLGRV